MPTVLGLILARRGSKRLPGKNMAPLRGIPLVGWTFAAARRAKLLSELLVSSDWPKLLEFAEVCGVNRVRRPRALAGDTVTSYEVIRPLLLLPRFRAMDYVCLLQPTSPIRDAADIDGCITKAVMEGHEAVRSVKVGTTKGNGSVYVAETGWLLAGGNWDSPDVATYEMPADRSWDIDTAEDLAELNQAMDAVGIPRDLTRVGEFTNLLV